MIEIRLTSILCNDEFSMIMLSVAKGVSDAAWINIEEAYSQDEA